MESSPSNHKNNSNSFNNNNSNSNNFHHSNNVNENDSFNPINTRLSISSVNVAAVSVSVSVSASSSASSSASASASASASVSVDPNLNLDTTSTPLTVVSLSLLEFAAISYFLVCGGPFGLEATIIAGGPLLSLIGFFVMPVIWSIPQALMTAELSCLIRSNGGYVVWVDRAFGRYSCWLASVNGLTSMIFDLALYPELAAEYVHVLMETTPTTKLIIKLLIVVLCIIVNILGLRSVGFFSALVTLLVTLPFLISFVVQFDGVLAGGYAWMQTLPTSEVQWGLFTSSLLWSFTGWDSLGCLAGEVSNPSYTFTRGPLLTLIFVLFTYCVPTIVSIQTHPDLSTWSTSSFSEFVSILSPELGMVTVCACVAANVAMFVAGLSASARAMMAMTMMVVHMREGKRGEREGSVSVSRSGRQEVKEIEKIVIEEEEERAKRSATASSSNSSLSPLLSSSECHEAPFSSPPFSSSSSSSHSLSDDEHTPISSLIVHGILISMLLPFDFKQLVQADMVLTCVRLSFEFGAFLKFRYSFPNAHRSFVVPGGWFGAFLITFPKVVVVGVIVLTADYMTWSLALVVNVTATILWIVIAPMTRTNKNTTVTTTTTTATTTKQADGITANNSHVNDGDDNNQSAPFCQPKCNVYGTF